MKQVKILSATVLLLLCSIIQAQTFHHNFEESRQLANDSNKLVLMIFSGSDWCKPCIQLRKEILEDTAFIAFSNKKLVLLELDFPYKRKNRLSKEQQEHNEQLAEKYNKDGAFPKVVLMDGAGNIIKTIVYKKNMTVDTFIDEIESITLTKKQASNDGNTSVEKE